MILPLLTPSSTEPFCLVFNSQPIQFYLYRESTSTSPPRPSTKICRSKILSRSPGLDVYVWTRSRRVSPNVGHWPVRIDPEVTSTEGVYRHFQFPLSYTVYQNIWHFTICVPFLVHTFMPFLVLHLVLNFFIEVHLCLSILCTRSSSNVWSPSWGK